MAVSETTTGGAMPRYLIQAAYTPEAWATMVKNPQDRAKAVKKMVDDAGGSLESFDFAFGDSDVVMIATLPDNTTAAGIAIAATAGGALKGIKTTPLMTPQEAIKAMKTAGKIAYEPPG
jgi:uncharacterized protein with GYD domain